MPQANGAAALVPTFDPRALRRAWGQFATGVTVVTVRHGDGARGMTANSFTSISLDPPLVMVSVAHRARTHSLIEASGRFAVSVLSVAHQAWADRFAGRQGERQSDFSDVPHRLTPDGLPLIDGALAHFVCRVVAVYPAGDHSIFLAEVDQFETHPGPDPLVFFGGLYRTLG